MFFGSVGEKAEVADTHEAVGEDVEEEAADELFGIEGHRFQPVFVSLKAKSGLDPLFSVISHAIPEARIPSRKPPMRPTTSSIHVFSQ